ncbi:leucine rich repeat LRR-containing protein [Nitzschia inconspicua]|uniref:Leucine rich repeat LRR-containing protein n=1 Tax=Nitzschia inconspicua TaxID=303405 RepID=A0A9K3KXI6_9STRA|nr:leucine rich repeat LRR-containing protein [Nitzschia inconspicua]
MTYLNIDNRSVNDGLQGLLERLRQEETRLSLTGLGLEDIELDETLLQALVDVLRLHHANNTTRKPATTLIKLSICNCQPNPFLEYLLEAAVGMDLFEEIEIQGASDESMLEEQHQRILSQQQNPEPNDEDLDNENEIDDDAIQDVPLFAIDALGFRIKFARRLRKLELINLLLTTDHVESLVFGIETNVQVGCQLTTLLLEGIIFVDNAGETVQELCDGLANNKTLRMIEIQRCRLTDHHVSLIFGALSSHPTLTTLKLAENHCRREGLKALDRLLTNPDVGSVDDNNTKTMHCQLSVLDLSHQVVSSDSFATETQFQLDFLSTQLIHGPAFYYPSLETLNLSGNQLQDSDMESVVTLIQRFPSLIDLDLRFNDITADGLQLFADISMQNMEGTFQHYCGLQPLRLTNNPLTQQASSILLELVKIYPRLSVIQSNVESCEQLGGEALVAQRALEHWMDINWAGRVLLMNQPNGDSDGYTRDRTVNDVTKRKKLPLGLWPNVLARLTKTGLYSINRQPSLNKRNANGLYHLIRHGPFFVEDIQELVSKKPMDNKFSTDDGYSHQTRGKRKRDAALGGYSSVTEFLFHDSKGR